MNMNFMKWFSILCLLLPIAACVGGVPVSRVMVGAPVVVGVVIAAIGVGIMVRTTLARVGSSRGVVRVALTIDSVEF